MDASVPRIKGELPLLVDVSLVRSVVVASDRLPVIAIEEGVLLVDHLAEGVVGLPAHDHAELPPGLRLLDVLVSVAVLLSVVVVEGLRELLLDARAGEGATDDVVALVDSLAGPGVEQAGGELSGRVIGKVVQEKLVVGHVTGLEHVLTDLVGVRLSVVAHDSCTMAHDLSADSDFVKEICKHIY